LPDAPHPILRGRITGLNFSVGETCDWSNVIRIWGKGEHIAPDKFNRIECQKATLANVRSLGKQIKVKRNACLKNISDPTRSLL
jgi:hypothetical protein